MKKKSNSYFGSAPAASVPDWFVTRPTDLTFPVYGNYKAYLWTKDASNNVSARAECY